MMTATRDLGRVQDIAAVLIRYGFGSIVHKFGLGQALERVGRTLHWQHAEEFVKLDTPQRVRHVLEELGPTFIKIGQILATRVDLFTPPYITEFEKLVMWDFIEQVCSWTEFQILQLRAKQQLTLDEISTILFKDRHLSKQRIKQIIERATKKIQQNKNST